MYKAIIIDNNGLCFFMDFPTQGRALQVLRGMHHSGGVHTYELFKVRS